MRLLFASLSTLLCPFTAQATVTNAMSGIPYATITNAVNGSQPGDVLLVGPGVYAEDVEIPHDLTLIGAGRGDTIIEGVGSGRVVGHGAYNVDLVLEDLTVTEGTNTGHLIETDIGGTLTLSRVELFGGYGYPWGGALSSFGSQSVHLTDVLIDGGTAFEKGGGVYAAGGSLDALRLTVRNTDAPSGGGVAADGSDFTCVDCTFEDTTATFGGAIWAAGPGVDVLDSSFSDTTASAEGGVLYSSGVPVFFENVAIDRPTANSGGALRTYGSTLTVRNTRICEPFVDFDGSAILSSATATLRNVVVVGPGGASALGFDGSGTGDVSIWNSAILAAPSTIGINLDVATYTIHNSVFEGLGEGIHDDAGTGVGTARYNLLHNNQLDTHNLTSTDSVFAAPGWVDFTDDGDCGNDLFGPTPASPMVDAGDPTVDDPDGSRSDIGPHAGAFGQAEWFADPDGDGWPDFLDCEPGSALINPGAFEVCDGMDNDCDGSIDEDDAVDAPLWYFDVDNDGYGIATGGLPSCTPLVSRADNNLDCDDTNPAIHPNADEYCTDQVDEDCDGDPLAGAVDPLPWGQDNDGDGFTGMGTLTLACLSPGGGWVQEEPSDCDDGNAAINPGVQELCTDAIDENCDGDATLYAIDTSVWSEDVDQDGYGNTQVEVDACTSPGPQWVQGVGTDCDDGDNGINPGAAELCDGIDNNCFQGETDAPGWQDWFIDNDNDGFGGAALPGCVQPPGTQPTGGDCDDGDATVFPGATEICDGSDTDCNGTVDDAPSAPWYEDRDRDGYHGQSQVSSCAPGPRWSDTTLGEDCDDESDVVYPGAPETCDNQDNDCDGLVDAADPDADGTEQVWTDADGDGFGEGDPFPSCDPGAEEQASKGGDCDDTNPEVHPDAVEIVDNDIDEDCDGEAAGDTEDRDKDNGAKRKNGEPGGCACDSTGGALPLPALLLLPLLLRRQR